VDLSGEYGLDPEDDDEDEDETDGEAIASNGSEDDDIMPSGGAAGQAGNTSSGEDDGGLYAPDQEDEAGDAERPPWEHESDDDGIGDAMTERGVDPEGSWKSALAETVAQERMKGTLPEVISAALDAEAAMVDWRQEMASYFNRKAGDKIRTDWTRMRKYRTANGGKYWLPRTKRSGIRVACLVDVSGSTSGFRQQFVSEIVTLLKDIPGSVLDVVLWTDVIVDNGIHTNVKTVADLPLEQIAAESGGTDVREAMQWAIDRPHGEEPDCIVVFTDGYLFGDYTKNKPRQDVVWVITIPGYYQHPWGKVIRLDPHR
jgi:predicted metal-dependent peptidase